MKVKFWSKDWFAAVAFSAVFMVLAYGFLADSFQGLERYTYDLGVRANDRAPSEDIAVIAIDDESIKKLGRWPWPRSLQAEMIDYLGQAGAKVITSTVVYSESQQDPGMVAIEDIANFLKASPLTQVIPGELQQLGGMIKDSSSLAPPDSPDVYRTWRKSKLATKYNSEIAELGTKIDDARKRLSADNVLGKAFSKVGKVIVPMLAQPGRPQGRPDKELPEYVQRNELVTVDDRIDARAEGGLPLKVVSLTVPVPELGEPALGVGHLYTTLDSDGAWRSEPLVVDYFDQLYPSLALISAARFLNIPQDDIKVWLGESVELGGAEIKTSPALRMALQFYSDRGGRPAFPVYSFFDVKEGKIQAEAFKDKLVVIGTNAAGTGAFFPTPVSESMAPVLIMAHSISSILQGHFFVKPPHDDFISFGVLVLTVLYLALLMPRLSPALCFAISGGLVAILLLTEFYLLAASAVWVKLTVPATLLVLGHLVMTVKKLRLTEILFIQRDAESSESNKMLGLAFQGQGQLDMAFEKFKRVQPVDDKVLDLLYNLALDFERKRQFNKAESVYQFISSKNAAFRDVQQKLTRAKRLSDTVIMGTGMGAQTAGGTLVLAADGGMEKAMLGRYQIEKELGKGAMGVVYLGKDPKIGRMVAIKTMTLAQDFEADELKEVKERFFREAEAAGNLSHPHIVQIFDAGEEHDLAYIAMEFIKGHDLVKYTKANALLPIADTLKYVADAAEALDYAHTRNIVHRDIKPANLMLLVDTRTIKVTDFGVARITDASKTKTGMVLGTPSYMSPEQLAGRKVDGRSDLFSLGVTLYQLLSGALPFQAESMATLMFKIANEPHAPITAVRPDLPPALNAVIEKILQKNFESRYQRGTDLARDLRAILATLA